MLISGGKSHYIKAKERAISLSKLIRSGVLDSNDTKIANFLVDDLNDALKRWK